MATESLLSIPVFNLLVFHHLTVLNEDYTFNSKNLYNLAMFDLFCAFIKVTYVYNYHQSLYL